MKIVTLRNQQVLMLLLNFAIIFGICWMYYYSVSTIAESGLSKSLLIRIDTIPRAPVQLLLTCMVVFPIYTLNIVLRKYWAQTKYGSVLFIVSCIIDLMLCFSLIIATSVVYRGILILSASCMLYLAHTRKQKLGLAIVLIALYIVCDYQVISRFIDIVPFQAYLDYLPQKTSSNLLTVQHILFSINDILFILFLFLWIQQQKDETSTINELYKHQYRINEELKLANIQLEHYMQQVEENALVSERNRLAREIHDTLGHSLTTLQAGLMSCNELVDKDQDLLRKQLWVLHTISQETLVDVRRSVKQLRPDLLNKLSLTQAIEKMANNISTLTDTGVTFTSKDVCQMPALYEDVIFHTVQESITNAVKHGQASHIDIRLECNKEGVFVSIHDNGVGCPNIMKGSGLRGIWERAGDLSGKVEVSGASGFLVTLYLPIKENEP